jgi:hypothetical protein
MKPLALAPQGARNPEGRFAASLDLAKALALVALGIALEAGFLLDAAVPPREAILAGRARPAAVAQAERPAGAEAPEVARAEAAPSPRS